MGKTRKPQKSRLSLSVLNKSTMIRATCSEIKADIKKIGLLEPGSKLPSEILSEEAAIEGLVKLINESHPGYNPLEIISAYTHYKQVLSAFNQQLSECNSGPAKSKNYWTHIRICYSILLHNQSS